MYICIEMILLPQWYKKHNIFDKVRLYTVNHYYFNNYVEYISTVIYSYFKDTIYYNTNYSIGTVIQINGLGTWGIRWIQGQFKHLEKIFPVQKTPHPLPVGKRSEKKLH